MAGTHTDTSSSDTILGAAFDRITYAADYAVTLFIAHGLTGITVGAAAAAGYAVSHYFTREVESEAIVEADTYYHPTAEINPETGREIINQVIDTKGTFRLSQIFAEATISPNSLIRILKRAAKCTTKDDPIVWSHLHAAMTRERRFFDWMPRSIAKRFGHYPESERKKIINEIARCYRNFRAEVLERRGPLIPELDPNERNRHEYKRDMAMLIFQEGAGADVFTLVKVPEGFETISLPDKQDTRFIYDDYDEPVEDPDSHLHERTEAMKSIQRRLAEDAALANPLLKKFFTRYKTGKTIPVPLPSTPAAVLG